MGKEPSPGGTPGLTETHEYLTSGDVGPLAKYRRLTVGRERGWGALLAYEFIHGCLAHCPGALGYILRQKLYRALFRRLGRGVAIGRNVTIRHPGGITLGDRVALDENVLLDARDGEISIGERTIVSRNVIISTRGGSIVIGAGCNIGTNSRVGTLKRLVIEDAVLLSHNCYLGGGNHRHDRLDIPIISQGMEEQRGLTIGRGAWIGAGSIILDGVTVGHDAIVGAASLVTQDVPPLAVAVGQPARVLRYRDGR